MRTQLPHSGDRSTVIYSKNSTETARYGYTDYVPAGDPSPPSRIFQTMVKLDTSNNVTNEEFHYAYDGSGRLLQAAFAQTPVSGYSPSTTAFNSGGTYYDSSQVAAHRARAYYLYDAGARSGAMRTPFRRKADSVCIARSENRRTPFRGKADTSVKLKWSPLWGSGSGRAYRYRSPWLCEGNRL